MRPSPAATQRVSILWKPRGLAVKPPSLRLARCREIEPFDPVIPGLDELDAAAPVLGILVHVAGNGRGSEIIEMHEEVNGRAPRAHEVLQHEEVHVAGEVTKQGKELAVPRETLGERASTVQVMAANAFHPRKSAMVLAWETIHAGVSEMPI